MVGDQHRTPACDRFRECLRQLWYEAGRPTPAELEKHAPAKALPRTTIDDHLHGRRRKPPTWRMVREYVEACRRYAGKVGLDVGAHADLADWHHRWTAAQAGDLDRITPLGGGDDPGH